MMTYDDWKATDLGDDFIGLEPMIEILCAACGSQGFIEYGHPNAPYPSSVVECEDCGGTGGIKVPVVPAERDDDLAQTG